MYQAILIYRIIACIATHYGIYRAAYIALFVQYVIQLQAYGKSISLEKTCRKLRIPQQFVSIELRVVETSSAAHQEISRERKVLPWEFHITAWTV